MKQIYLTLVIALGVIFSQSANALTVLTEQFIGYSTGELGATGTGDTGGIPGWNTARSHITVTNGSGSLDGTGLGLIESAGDMVYITSTANTNDNYDEDASGRPNGAYNKFANKGSPYPEFWTTNNVNLYVSFLYQFNDNTNFAPGGVSMIAAMIRQSSGIQSGDDADWELFARTNGAGNIQLGIAKNAPPIGVDGNTNWAPTTVAVGQTFFVVVRQQILATNGVAAGTNEEDDLWINPPAGAYPAGSFGAPEANVPTPDAISPVGDGTPDASTTGPGRFFITDNGPTANFDELRIATNWADVTPPLGQCNAAAFTTNPTNITQSAEINATLTAVAAGSTSPTYQWQINRNGDSTWTNISGAVHSSYTTPNLQLATDNGNQYRSIAHVACDGSSATSSVATVTLTAPAVTLPGLIEDDTWADQLRGSPPPVSTSHSVWWTAVTADLDAYPGDNGYNLAGMFSTQISNTSSLYLGYFVDESTTNLPVDLAIGTTITATINFTPLNFDNFVTNYALEFGLFDYADGATLITADGPNVTGSLGNGQNVRGYMVGVDFGNTFVSNTPVALYTRTGLGDNNLMGTTGDYLSMGYGPAGGSYAGTTAFQDHTNYTVVLSVTRTDTNACSVTATITGGGLNLSYSGTDTNNYGYHRFDSFGIHDNKQQNTSDYFDFTEFKVQVAAAPVQSIAITSVSHTGNNVALTWQPVPNASYTYTVQRKTSLTDPTWTTLQSGISGTSYTDTTATGSTGFYRVSSP